MGKNTGKGLVGKVFSPLDLSGGLLVEAIGALSPLLGSFLFSEAAGFLLWASPAEKTLAFPGRPCA